MVGDLALQLAASNADPAEFAAEPERFDVPDSVLRFLAGELGVPENGWPEPFRTRALAGREPVLTDAVVSDDERAALEGTDRRITLSRLLFPGPTAEYEASLASYGELAALPSSAFFFGLEHGEEGRSRSRTGRAAAVRSGGDRRRRRARMRNVVCTLNGQLRPLSVRDLSLQRDIPAAERANPNDPLEVGAPFTGVATLRVARGQHVEAGEVIATIEAMKMEASVTATVAGDVVHIAVERVAQVQAGDLLVRLG